MAVTVLKHMKECPSWKPQHLSNAIKYILDIHGGEEKTDFGKWVGGNSGTDYDTVFENFMNTKKIWNKESGRQGYHFMISFPPGEVDAQTCYNVIEEFCQEYMGDAYDYLFAVHTDQDHMHGHIVFNSINRETGYKYRYEKGDWEKSIQPVTDKLCEKYGLSPLTFEKEKTGESYAKWLEKEGKLNWGQIIRADLDYAVSRSNSVDDFFSILHQMNYKISYNPNSYSKRTQKPYVTYIFTDEKGVEHKHRSMSLAGARDEDFYNLEAIEEKIKGKALSKPYCNVLSEKMEQKMNVRLGQMSTVLKGTRTYKRMYQAVSYYKLPNPFAVPQQSVRRDMLRIEKLMEECAYLNKQPHISLTGLANRKIEVEKKLKQYYTEKKALEKAVEEVKEKMLPQDVMRYRQLQKRFSEIRDFDDEWEKVSDELERMEKVLPAFFVDAEKRMSQYRINIGVLNKEKKILERVIRTEGGIELMKEPKMQMHVTPGKKI